VREASSEVAVCLRPKDVVATARREAAVGRREEGSLSAAAASWRGVEEAARALEAAGARSRAAAVVVAQVGAGVASQGVGVGRPAGVEAPPLRGSQH